jgi:hypothetical protein
MADDDDFRRVPDSSTLFPAETPPVGLPGDLSVLDETFLRTQEQVNDYRSVSHEANNPSLSFSSHYQQRQVSMHGSTEGCKLSHKCGKYTAT